MYGGRYSLTRYSLGAGEGTIEAGEAFSAVLSGLTGGAVPVDAGQVFSGELGGTTRGTLAVDASLDARARLLSQGRLGAAVAVGAPFAAALNGRAQAGKESRTVLLDESGECVIPWEVLAEYHPLTQLKAGVYGSTDDTALPTTWASLGTILEGVPGDGEGSKPPTPDLWEQDLDRKGDTLAYDGLNLSLKSGDKTLSSVEIAGGEGGGTSDHRALANRDAAEQHPINSITGLSARLDQTMSKGDALTVQEILKIMEVS